MTRSKQFGKPLAGFQLVQKKLADAAQESASASLFFSLSQPYSCEMLVLTMLIVARSRPRLVRPARPLEGQQELVACVAALGPPLLDSSRRARRLMLSLSLPRSRDGVDPQAQQLPEGAVPLAHPHGGLRRQRGERRVPDRAHRGQRTVRPFLSLELVTVERALTAGAARLLSLPAFPLSPRLRLSHRLLTPSSAHLFVSQRRLDLRGCVLLSLAMSSRQTTSSFLGGMQSGKLARTHAYSRTLSLLRLLQAPTTSTASSSARPSRASRCVLAPPRRCTSPSFSR